MRSLFWGLIAVLLLAGLTPLIERWLPPGYDPFAPLSIDDPPTVVTRFKLSRLAGDPDGCLAVLERAREAQWISFSLPGDSSGQCPLSSPVRVQGFGSVALSSSFLASCPLALSSAMFVAQVAIPEAQSRLDSPLARIDHLGSYACRNVYHREQGRLSEHATADALDVSGFRLGDGRELAVLRGWGRDDEAGAFLHTLFERSCSYFGNSIGPDYNAAHANHFHLGMRGFGICR
ncbi:extensin family protein [Halotalea alkalilenta]|uniref:extensin-like domain-containing protein n=1 Tax=Halotalea alkalilenta TaxID=376489 RepID=UPI00048903FC|nr:extensin family protein [Halotalea alkalilenta]